MSSVEDFKLSNPVQENRSGLIGKALSRYDGMLKVTGAATYACEVQPPSPPAYGFLVCATVAQGRVGRLDTAAARAAPGVKLVWTHRDMPAQGPRKARVSFDPYGGCDPALVDDRVRYFGQPIALVVADTFENARGAALLVAAAYEDVGGEVDFAAGAAAAAPAPGMEDSRVGDFEAAFAAAPVKLDETWTTPVQNHCQMEPHGAIAWWEGDEVTVHASSQGVIRPRNVLAETLQLAPEKVRFLSRYVGGGFGGKFFSYEDATLACLASRALGQPVKIAFTRQQMFHGTIHRAATVQRVRLGAGLDGRLTAMGLESATHCARGEVFTEAAAAFARSLYAAPNRLTGHRLLQLDLPMAGPMRAPGEAVGMLSLECAMDELAERLGLDPVELRIRNEPERDPEAGRPFSTRQLVECLREGAARFGWADRNPVPGRAREGRWLVGLGMSSAIRANFVVPAEARVRLDPDGVVTLQQAMTDIGTGSYTILAQIVAETMGVDYDQVRVELGDSKFAPTLGSGGSFGAASAGSAALDAGMKLRRQLAALAVGDPASPLHGAAPEAAEFHDGMVAIGNRAERLADIAARAGPDGVEAHGAVVPPADAQAYSQHAYGAYFAEVGVDSVSGETRLRRMLGVFAAGRILNAKTARSQLTGGMIWGVGGALTEGNAVDTRYGSFLNQDLSQYLAPSHADIVDLDAILLPEVDDKANPMGIKGIGELGVCGAGAAVANAVYNACGVRVRDYPITPDKVLAGLA